MRLRRILFVPFTILENWGKLLNQSWSWWQTADTNWLAGAGNGL